MDFHRFSYMCWHLSGRNLGKTVFSLQGITEMNVAWNFVKEMKSNSNIDEIIWTRHEEDGKVYDETLHLIKKNGDWLKNDIVEWNKTKNKI